jgi:putative ABC transport system permease protein
MKWLPLLWTALRRKPARTVFTLLSIVIAFLLVGIMSGLNAAFAERIENARLDRMVVTARYGVWYPIAYLDQIARMDGVSEIVPAAFIEASYQEPTNRLFIRMTDPRARAVLPELNVTPDLMDELERIQDGLILSRELADRLRLGVGDRIPLETDRVFQDGTRTWGFNVLAIVPDSARWPAGFSVGNYRYLSEGRADTNRRNDIHEIVLRIDDPARANATAAAIEALFANSGTPVIATPERTLIENNLRGVIDMQFFTYAFSAASLFMILFLTANVMAQSVRERVPEFAVMKAVGFSDRSVTALVLLETIVLCLLGAGLGLMLAKAIPTLANAILPNAPDPVITPSVIGFTIGSAILVAVMSAVPAVWRLKRLVIADALAGR